MLAEGNVHQIRDSSTSIRTWSTSRRNRPRTLAREFLVSDDVLNLKFEDKRSSSRQRGPMRSIHALTEIAASGELGAIHEVTSPDENLQAVFEYLVKS